MSSHLIQSRDAFTRRHPEARITVNGRTCVNAVGASQPGMREIDEEMVKSASPFVD